MLTTKKIKWLISLTLASILLVLALIGGDWGKTYAAIDGFFDPPHIDQLFPSGYPVGWHTDWIIISGSNFSGYDSEGNPFGDTGDTRVRLSGKNYDEMFTPKQIIEDGISIEVDGLFFGQPESYIITVVRSTNRTIPTIPTIDPVDLVSNKVFFQIYETTFLPIINKK